MEENKRVCPNCQTPVDEGVRFCPKCGARIEPDATGQGAQEQGTQEQINQGENTQTQDTQGQGTQEQINQEQNTQAQGGQWQGTQTQGQATQGEYYAAQGAQAQAAQGEYYAPEGTNTSSGKSLGKNKFILLGIIAAIVVVVIVVIAVLVSRPKTVDLNKYLSLECEGYDGYGYVTSVFDEDAFLADYDGKLKVKARGQSLESLLIGIADPVEAFYYYCVWYELDYGDLDENALSNGDTITLKWDCDDDSAKSMFGVKLKYSDTELTVEGLTELKEVDAFEGVTLVSTEPYPIGTIELINDSETKGVADLTASDFELSAESGVRNGDVITITLTDDAIDYLVNAYGEKPVETTMQYTVDDMDEKVAQLSDITDDFMDEIVEEAKDELVSHESAYYNYSYEHLDSVDYVGAMLFSDEKGLENEGSFKTRLVLVYRLNSTVDDDSFSYFSYVKLYSPMLMSDGTMELQDDRMLACNHSFYYHHDHHGSMIYMRTGYETLAETIDAINEDMSEFLTCDSDVDDSMEVEQTEVDVDDAFFEDEESETADGETEEVSEDEESDDEESEDEESDEETSEDEEADTESEEDEAAEETDEEQ